MPDIPFYLDHKHNVKYRKAAPEEKRKILGKARKQIYKDLDKLPDR